MEKERSVHGETRAHGGSSVMAWRCMTASGTGSLIFIGDRADDGNRRMNSEV